MSWRTIVYVFKRLDDRLSDAVYAHGRYLTGQQKIVRKPPRVEAAIKDLSLRTRGIGVRRAAQLRAPLLAAWARRRRKRVRKYGELERRAPPEG
jgi:hypothetical protein